MKKIILSISLFIISCSGKYNYKYDRYTINTIFTGRASEKAIEKDSLAMKQSTCCEGAQLNSKMITLRNYSDFVLDGNRETNTFSIFGNGKIIQIEDSKCLDRKNNFEECYCILDIQNKYNDILEKEIASSSKIRWITNNTYIIESKGKALNKAIDKKSLAMKESSCIDAAQTNGIKSMIFDLQEEVQNDKKTVNLKTRLPMIYLKYCESDNDFTDCNCKYALYEEGLKERFTKELKESKIK